MSDLLAPEPGGAEIKHEGLSFNEKEAHAAVAKLLQQIQTPLPTIGSLVHYVLGNGRYAGEHRPATIVKIWGEATAGYTPAVQLQVLTDGTNDFEQGQNGANGLLWATSVSYSEEPRPYTWHWPENV